MLDYNYADFWDYDDLDEKTKELALEVGCRPRKTYKGPIDAPIEALYCPYCNKLVEDVYYDFETGDDITCCEHLVYIHNSQNFTYLNKNYAFDVFQIIKENSGLIAEISDDDLIESIENSDFDSFYKGIINLSPMCKDFETLTEGKFIEFQEEAPNTLLFAIQLYSYGFFKGA